MEKIKEARGELLDTPILPPSVESMLDQVDQGALKRRCTQKDANRFLWSFGGF